MALYIKKNIPGFYAEFPERLDPASYNNIGSGWEDFLDGKWVLLNHGQEVFKARNKNASVHEVFNMHIESGPDSSITLDDIKDRKEQEIWEYDRSPEINSCVLFGNEVWYSKEERQSLKMRFEAERECGKTETVIWFENMEFNMSLTDAFSFLAKLENYAAECFDNTKRHISEMRQLENDKMIYSYEYKNGYPKKLNIGHATK